MTLALAIGFWIIGTIIFVYTQKIIRRNISEINGEFFDILFGQIAFLSFFYASIFCMFAFHIKNSNIQNTILSPVPDRYRMEIIVDENHQPIDTLFIKF